MKKINISSLLLIGVYALIGCSQDTDSNPIYRQPDSFVLNTPAYATAIYDLENSESLEFTCVQPDYGFTAATTYAVQLSFNDVWTDETETAAATYQELSTTSTQAKILADAVEMAKAIVMLSGWTGEDDFDGQDIELYVRLKATVASMKPAVYSNSVKIKVLPYYIELKDADPSFFFLVGNYVGGWDIGMGDIGRTLIPMSLVPEYVYDKKTGAGKFTYTGYFEAATNNNGFKLIGMINGAISWNEQWGNGEDGDLPGNTDLKHLHSEGGNPGHLGVAESGWYKIDVNDNEEQKLTFEKLDKEPHAAFESIQLLGEFSEWDTNPVEMTRIASTTHSWTTTITFNETGVVKFRANRGWDTNWGNDAEHFPFGLGQQGAKDIPVQPGEYIVTFNDIEGSYAFFIQE